MKHRTMGLHERELPDQDLLRLMSAEHTCVTRPVSVRGDREAAGFRATRPVGIPA